MDAQLREIRAAQSRRYQSLSEAEKPRLRRCSDCASDVYTLNICPVTGYYHDRHERKIVGGVRLEKGQRQVTSGQLMSALDAARVKWQAARLASVRVDTDSINIFQTFSVERQWKAMHYGIMYGVYDTATNVVTVHAIFEPDQEVHAEGFKPLKDDRVGMVDKIAAAFDLQPVGIACTHGMRDPEHMIVSGPELLLTARMASRVGPHCVLVTIGPNQELQAINAVAWQLSEQSIELFRLGIFSASDEHPAVLHSTVNLEVAQEIDEKGKKSIVTKEPSKDIDCRWMIGHLAIEAFSSERFDNRFMRLTRPGTPPPTLSNLKAFLLNRRSLPFDKRIADFHALVFMAANIFDVKDDMPIIIGAIHTGNAKTLKNYEALLDSYLSHN